MLQESLEQTSRDAARTLGEQRTLTILEIIQKQKKETAARETFVGKQF